jgi:hypothetical protein
MLKSLIKRMGGYTPQNPPASVLIARIDFPRPVRFPELERMFGLMRNSIERDISYRATQEVTYSDLPMGQVREDRLSDVKKRTTDIVGTIPRENVIFDVSQIESDQSVLYTGFQFRSITELPLTETNLQTIDRCRGYVGYHFTRFLE